MLSLRLIAAAAIDDAVAARLEWGRRTDSALWYAHVWPEGRC